MKAQSLQKVFILVLVGLHIAIMGQTRQVFKKLVCRMAGDPVERRKIMRNWHHSNFSAHSVHLNQSVKVIISVIWNYIQKYLNYSRARSVTLRQSDWDTCGDTK
jgi:hypothetical protein